MKKQTYKTTQPLEQGYFAVEKQKQDHECSTGFFGKEAEVTLMYLDDVHKQMHSGLESYLAKESQQIQESLALAKKEREKRLDAQGLTTPYDFSFLKEKRTLRSILDKAFSWRKSRLCTDVVGWTIAGAVYVGLSYMIITALKDYEHPTKTPTQHEVSSKQVQEVASKLFDMRTMDYKP